MKWLHNECRNETKNLYCIKNSAHCGGYDVLDHERKERRLLIDEAAGRVATNSDIGR